MTLIRIVVPLALLLVGCASSRSTKPSLPQPIEELTQLLTGYFSTEAQAKQDTSFFDIRLHMTPIWTARVDGKWLYVEQAEVVSLTKPYRQRINHLFVSTDGLVHSQVYEIPAPLRFVGAWKDTSLLAGLNPDSLISRVGCVVSMQRDALGVYRGTTMAKTCLSNWRGAHYTTTEVEIGPSYMISWDRGWNKQGEQVWGSRKGGYRFVKQ